jgi:DNA-binding transcriptional LysR family regulator
MLHCVVPHVAEFRAMYPEIRLELSSNDQIADLIEHRTDIAIRIGTLTTPRCARRPPARCTCWPARNTWSSTARRAQPEDLARHTLLGFAVHELGNQWPLRHAPATACR